MDRRGYFMLLNKRDKYHYLAFTNLEDREITLTVKKSNANAPTVKFYYSDSEYSKGTYAESSTDGVSVPIPAGGVLYLRGVGNTRWGNAGNQYNRIYASGRFGVSGKLSDLCDQNWTPDTTTAYYYAFGGLFINSQVVDASELVLDSQNLRFEYYQMFSGCSKLTEPPKLPWHFAEKAGYRMFYNCTALEKVPPAPDGGVVHLWNTYAMHEMFMGCTALTTLWEDIELRQRGSNYLMQAMFSGCTSLQDAGGVKITFASSGLGVCMQMFSNCTALVNAPALPATTLQQSCYMQMFQGCTSLVNAPALPATTLQKSCYMQMFYGCTSLVNAPSLAHITEIKSSCFAGMFQGCTSLTAAQDLGNIVLPTSGSEINNAFSSMYYGCTKIAQAPVLPDIPSYTNSMISMFQDCTSMTGVARFTKNVINGAIRMFRNTKISGVESVSAQLHGTGAFSDNNRLKNVTLQRFFPDDFVSGTAYMFTLDTLTIRGNYAPATITQSFINALAPTCPIKVHANQVDAYKSAAVWSSRAAYISAIE